MTEPQSAHSKDLEDLKERVGVLEKQLKHDSVPKTKTKIKKAPSEYNKFMSKEIARLKKENPELDHKTAFRNATQSWGQNKK
tara:strand:- start:184 stop:429 length:246 start_codon:yes stop_codon:yes gene_type:complete